MSKLSLPTTILILACASVVNAAEVVPDGIYQLMIGGETSSAVGVVRSGKFTRTVTAGNCTLVDAVGNLRDGILYVSVPDRCWNKSRLDLRNTQGPLKFQDSTSWYLNTSTSTTDGNMPSISLESGLFFYQHFIFSDAYLDAATDRYNRGETFVERDIPSKTSKILIGDHNINAGSGLFVGKRIAGLQFARNWQQDPDRAANVYYSSSHQLKLSSRSVVEFFRDGQLVDRRDLPPGDYDIRNIPAVAYSSRVKMKITDSFGNITETEADVINPPRLLAKGVFDYSFSAGSERISFVDGGDYRGLVGGGYIGYGLTNWSSIFVSAVDQTISGTATIATPIGLLSGELRLDNMHDWRAGYSYSWRNIGVNAEYRELAQLGQPRRTANANISAGFDTYGTLSARYIKGDDEVFGLTHNASLPLNMTMNSSADISRTGAVAYGVSFSRSWTQRFSTQISYNHGLNSTNTIYAQVSYTLDRAKPASVGLVASSTTANNVTTINTRAEGRYGLYASVSNLNSTSGPLTTTATVAGAIACVDGTCRVGEPVSGGGYAVGDYLTTPGGQNGSLVPLSHYSNVELSASTRSKLETTTVAVRRGQGVKLLLFDRVAVQALIYFNGRPAAFADVVWDGGKTMTGDDGLLWLDRMPKKTTLLRINGHPVVLPLDGFTGDRIINLGRVDIGIFSADAQKTKEFEK